MNGKTIFSALERIEKGGENSKIEGGKIYREFLGLSVSRSFTHLSPENSAKNEAPFHSQSFNFKLRQGSTVEDTEALKTVYNVVTSHP